MNVWRTTFVFLCLSYQVTSRQSVLMLIIDDLRSSISDGSKTDDLTEDNNLLKLPNIDKLAKRGVKFNYAYTQYAMCSPSRSSLLTGTRPDTTQVFDLITHFRHNLPTVITLPQMFRNEGYLSYGIGKVFHRGYGDEPSFSMSQPHVDKPAYCLKTNVDIDMRRKEISHSNGVMKGGKVQRGPAIEMSYGSNCSFHDDTAADVAIETLQKLAKGSINAAAAGSAEWFESSQHSEFSEMDKPFFLAVGFIRPHLPWVAPTEYWNRHLESNFNQVEDSLPKDRRTRLPAFVLQGGAHELASYYGIDMNTLTRRGHSDENPQEDMIFTASQLRHGYAASASYSDAQVGRVLNELERLNLDKVTNVVLWSDHGYKLGEHGGSWGKNSNTNYDTHVPLIVALPTFLQGTIMEKQENIGWETDALVELVDVYPTLLDLCGITKHEGEGHPLEGSSFKQLLINKTLAQSFTINKSTVSISSLVENTWKSAVFSQVARKYITGYSMRTPRFRYTVWIDTRSIITEKSSMFDSLSPSSQVEVVETQVEVHEEDLKKASERRERIDKNKLDKKKIKFIECYDLWIDPYEVNNVSEDKQYIKIKHLLSDMWEKGFCGAIPSSSIENQNYITPSIC